MRRTLGSGREPFGSLRVECRSWSDLPQVETAENLRDLLHHIEDCFRVLGGHP